MNNIERAYPNTNHDTITLSNLKFKFTATLTVPEGMTLPATLMPTPFRLPTLVVAADVHGWMKLTIPGVTIGANTQAPPAHRLSVPLPSSSALLIPQLA